MYAIVKAGGRQEKVSVGETLVVDRLDAAVGSSVTFPVIASSMILLKSLVMPIYPIIAV